MWTFVRSSCRAKTVGLTGLLNLCSTGAKERSRSSSVTSPITIKSMSLSALSSPRVKEPYTKANSICCASGANSSPRMEKTPVVFASKE